MSLSLLCERVARDHGFMAASRDNGRTANLDSDSLRLQDSLGTSRNVIKKVEQLS